MTSSRKRKSALDVAIEAQRSARDALGEEIEKTRIRYNEAGNALIRLEDVRSSAEKIRAHVKANKAAKRKQAPPPSKE